jgi:hypothetical protein
MGNVISWILSNIGQDERQGEAREENQPQSLAGELTAQHRQYENKQMKTMDMRKLTSIRWIRHD